VSLSDRQNRGVSIGGSGGMKKREMKPMGVDLLWMIRRWRMMGREKEEGAADNC